MPSVQGPSGLPLNLRHEQRGQASMMEEVGRLLANVCQAVPEVGTLSIRLYACLKTDIQSWPAHALLFISFALHAK